MKFFLGYRYNTPLWFNNLELVYKFKKKIKFKIIQIQSILQIQNTWFWASQLVSFEIKQNFESWSVLGV